MTSKGLALVRGALSTRAFRATLFVVAFLGLWEAASRTGIFGLRDPFIARLLLPSPGTVFEAGIELSREGLLFSNILTTLLRVGAGFVLGGLIGVVLGVVMGSSPFCFDFFDPFVRIFQPIPGVAWVPLAIIWFGLGNGAAIFIITVGTLFPVTINTITGVQSVEPMLVKAALTLGAGRRQILLHVMIPSMIPYLLSGLRVGMGISWRVVVAAEMVGVPSGIGMMLMDGRSLGRTEITILSMLLLGILMLLTERLLFHPLERRTMHWKLK